MTTMTAATTNVKYRGRTYQVTSYVDPHPGRKTTDRVDDGPCGKCGGSGVYTGRSGLKWGIMTGRKVTVNTWCFECDGSGRSITTVARARRAAKIEAVWREYGEQITAEEDAAREIAYAADRLRQQMEAWDEAHAENERRAGLNNTLMGQPGDKLKDIEVTVEVAKTVEVPGFRYGTDLKKFVVLKTADGQVAKVFGTSASLWSLERGDRAIIKSATVKGEDEWNGQVQTTLTRVKVERIDTDEE
ncbi:hypothetical protein SEA_TYPHA_101 [Mycobacterium phage Typha]|uniref:SsDNA binding protein n=1 Tax=Mycobacterium phage Typha TaxID=2517971 RepID=A0A482JDN6_9CAUD|nr:hypothetical protein KCH40_gp068 [Mycobacterium phage Typha]QBP29756.1 hypothetical protein SEA_TYPHA_101 [Mycobacterium phage Typha]